MSKNVCALCRSSLTKQNQSAEHVIPRSIGGRLKVTGFICRACNSKKGSSWDTNLAKKFNSLSLFLHIKREGPPPPKQTFNTVTGEQIVLHPDGHLEHPKPHIEISKKEEKMSYRYSSSSKKELGQFLKATQRKNPKLTDSKIAEIVNKTKIQETYTDKKFIIFDTLESLSFEHSAVKSAWALASKIGVKPEYCDKAYDFLENDGEACIWPHYADDILNNRQLGEPIHYISICSDAHERKLLGYVEYFGFLSFIIILSTSYDGDEIQETYSINPVTGLSFNASINFERLKRIAKNIKNSEQLDSTNIRKRLESIIQVGQKRSYDKECERVVSSAYTQALEIRGLKEGDEMTLADIKFISHFIAKKTAPFGMHLGNRTIRSVNTPTTFNFSD